MSQSAFAVTVPAEAGYLRVIRSFFQSVLEERFGADAAMLVLALDEACSNIVKYRSKALDRELISVRAEIQSRCVRFRIGDFCASEDVPKIRPRDLSDVRPGGLGTHFMTEIMDEMRFEPEPNRPGRMALMLEKTFQDGGMDHGTKS